MRISLILALGAVSIVTPASADNGKGGGAKDDGMKTKQISMLPSVQCTVFRRNGTGWDAVGKTGMGENITDNTVVIPVTGILELRPNNSAPFTAKINGKNYTGYPQPPAEAVELGKAGKDPYRIQISLSRSKNSGNGNDQVNVELSPLPSRATSSTDFVQLYDDTQGTACKKPAGGTAASGGIKLVVEDTTTKDKKTKSQMVCSGAMMTAAKPKWYTEIGDFTWTPAGGEETTYIYGMGTPVKDQAFQFKTECTLTRNSNRDDPKLNPNIILNPDGSESGGADL